ncbi:MAG: response regulator [Nitrospirota bacterium]
MKPSVLIVDDEEVIRNGLARLLEDNCITYKAFNGREAIEILDNHRDIDVMLCDIMMPEMEGIETIEKIRSYNKDISIIIITAVSSPLTVCDAMRKGANYFMRKPLDINQLELAIKSLSK